MHQRDLEEIVKRIRGRLCRIDVAWITTDIKDALLGADNPSGANTFLTEENLNNYLSQDIIDALEAATTASGSNRYATMLDLMGIEPGTLITVVANYAAFPPPATVTGEFYWAEASQGIEWLPGSWGGTFYGRGLYYSNGVTWEPIPVPFQATQAEVNAGINNDRFVTPLTGQVAYAFKPGISGGQTLVGGTQITDALTLQGTSGNGTLTDKAIRVLVGNNGSTEALNVTNNGYVNVGQRIYLGTATGTGRINLPDGGTTSADGIWFESSIKIFRSASQILNIETGSATWAFAAGSFRLPTNQASFIRMQPGRNFAIDNGTQNIFGINGTSYETSLTPPTLTGSSATSALSITQTWNTTGSPTAIFANITNTASGASANLMDLQVGGVSQFKVSKAGLTSGVSGGLSINYNTGGGSINGGTNGRFTITQNFGFAIYNISNPANTGITIGANADPNASAILDIRSTNKGVIFPNMTTAQKNAIASPANGLVVFDTTLNKLCVFTTVWETVTSI